MSFKPLSEMTTPLFKYTSFLLVDSNIDSLRLTSLMLEQHGGAVVAVSSAIEAIDMAMQFQPNVFITTLVLPELDGCMLLPFIQRLVANPFLAVLLSTYNESNIKQRASKAGFHQCLTVPLDYDAFIDNIAEAMQLDSNLLLIDCSLPQHKADCLRHEDQFAYPMFIG